MIFSAPTILRDKQESWPELASSDSGETSVSDKVKVKTANSRVKNANGEAKANQAFPPERPGDSALISAQVLAMWGPNSLGLAIRKAVCSSTLGHCHNVRGFVGGKE